MKRLVFTPAARADLTDIHDYIAADNPQRAVSFIDEIEHRCVDIAGRPKQFALRQELGAGVRSAPHGRYVILFRELDDRVRILRVLHSARDLPALLK